MTGAWLVVAALAHPGAAEMHPHGCDVEGWLGLARALTSDGAEDDALDAIDHAEACGADPSRIALARGLATSGERAVPHLRRAVALLPEHAGARLALARALAETGHREEALDHAREGLARIAAPHPDDVLLAASLAEPAEALVLLDDGLRRSGPTPALIEAAARAEVALGRLDAALARVTGDTVHDQALRARLCAEAGQIDRARDAYDRAIAAADAFPRRTPALLTLRRELAAERSELP